jgi:hypothetical protein
MNNNSVSQEFVNKMHENCNTALLNLVKTYKRGVADEIKDEALKMLYDYWGKNYVDRIFAYMAENNL